MGLQDKADKQGAGGTGIALIEPSQCKDWNDPLVQLSASRTVGSCKENKCDNGCCRYHTAFLTCDTKNAYTHLSCACDATEPIDDNRDVPTNGNDSVVIGVTPPPQPLPVYPPVGQEKDDHTCQNGSVWQGLGFDYANCSSSADCEGVLKNGEQTCCKRSFCWCGAFDIRDEECVA